MNKTTIKKVAILLDGGFVIKKLGMWFGRRPVAKEIVKFAVDCLSEDEELFRIYYYDCPPYGKKLKNPLSNQTTDYSTTAILFLL